MEVTKIVLIALTGAMLAVVIKPYRPDFSLIISVITSLFLIIYSVELISKISSTLFKIADNAALGENMLSILLKAVAITYLCQFASDACRDAGESSIASKIELAGRTVILILAMPVFVAILKTLNTLTG